MATTPFSFIEKIQLETFFILVILVEIICAATINNNSVYREITAPG
ncbi:MAG: hypothetical protein PHC56_10600 [Herbinix sp.]|nr:hypothetical protein [Herbinix sp.]